MARPLSYLSHVVGFLTGVATATLTIFRSKRRAAVPPALDDLQKSVAKLQARMQLHTAANAERINQIETVLAAHTAALQDVPSTSQIVACMEQLLSKAMTNLDERLASHASSIEILRAAVAQTDSLLSRVLESLDTLQGSVDPTEFDDSLLTRSAG